MNWRTYAIGIVAIILMTRPLLAGEAGHDDGNALLPDESPSGPPKIVAGYPADGYTQAMGTEVILGFDRPMDQGTITIQTILVNDQPLQTVQPDARLVFPDPTGRGMLILFPLLQGGVYKMSLNTDIADEQGQHLAEPFVWHFATRLRASSLEEPPQLVAHYPRDGETAVPTDAPITMQWSFDMHDSSFTDDHLVISPVDDKEQRVQFQVLTLAERAICRPNQPLKPNTSYRVQPTSLLRSVANIGAASTPAWQFTTGAGPANGPYITDVWSKAVNGPTQRSVILAAAIENLKQPAGKVLAQIEGWPEPVELLDNGNFFTHADIAPRDGLFSARIPVPAEIKGGQHRIRWLAITEEGEKMEPVESGLEIPAAPKITATRSAPASQPD